MEITQKLSDPTQTRNDMRDAMGLVANMLRERYITRMKDTFVKFQEHSRSEPSKEVTLLRSLKPFMPADSHENIEKMAEMLILADAFGNMGKMRDAGTVIHEDGVYEIDQKCMELRQSHEKI